jgi:hypothetical protein
MAVQAATANSAKRLRKIATYPRAPQLPHIGTQHTEPQIYWIVKHGIRMTAMSAYGRFYSEQELWSIAAFIHQIRSFDLLVSRNANPRKICQRRSVAFHRRDHSARSCVRIQQF